MFTGSRKFERLALPRTIDGNQLRSLGFLYPCGTEHQVAGHNTFVLLLLQTSISAPTLIFTIEY